MIGIGIYSPNLLRCFRSFRLKIVGLVAEAVSGLLLLLHTVIFWQIYRLAKALEIGIELASIFIL